MKYIVCFFCAAVSVNTNAQQLFIDKGHIEFEKQENLLNRFNEESSGEGDNMFTDAIKKSDPQSEDQLFRSQFCQ